MEVEKAVRAKINTIAELTNKVFPLSAPEGTTAPYVVYVTTADTETDTLGGWIGSYDATVEINVIHSSYSGMKSMSKTVISALKTLNDSTYGGVDFQAVHIDSNQPELYEKEIDMYRKIINFTANY